MISYLPSLEVYLQDTFQKAYAFFISFCCQNAPIATQRIILLSTTISQLITTVLSSSCLIFFSHWEVRKNKRYVIILIFLSECIRHGTSFHMFRKASLFPFPSHCFSPQLDQFILHFSTVLPSVALECILICGSTCAPHLSSLQNFPDYPYVFFIYSSE